MTITRRAALIATGAVAAPAIWRRLNAQGLRKVSFTMPWLPEGAYAYAYVTKAGGYWSKRGFEVTISRGYGSLASGQAIAQSTFDLGLSQSQSVVLLAAKGLDLRGIALMDYDPSMSVAFLKSSGIRTPKDLEGKTIGQTLTSADAPFFKPFCELTGVDMSKVHLLNLDARLRNQAVVQKTVDAITGFASSILPTLGSEQDPLRVFMYRDNGLDLYGNVLLTVRPETLAKDRELCQGILDGLMEGLKFTETQPEQAQDLFLQALPELRLSADGPRFSRLGIGMQRFSFISTTDALDHGMGWMNIPNLAKMSDLVMRYQADAGTQKPDIAKIFTNELIGAVKITPAEWQTTQSKTEWVDAMVHPKA